MATKRSIAKKLKRVDETRERQLRKLGAVIRREYVIPACLKHGLQFSVETNGRFSFYDDKGDSIHPFLAHAHAYHRAVRAYEILQMDVGEHEWIGAWVGNVDLDADGKVVK